MKIRKLLAWIAVSTVVVFAILHYLLILPGSSHTIRSPGGTRHLLLTSENSVRHNGAMKLVLIVVDSRTGIREATIFTHIDSFYGYPVSWEGETQILIRGGTWTANYEKHGNKWIRGDL